mmetsp:Transcript_21779/g.49328  ORF Transcript_21779/g.49328 Transcript_21779/m.49328 type:complete len:292 (+) Transcript_21779:392-1267(+)
MPFGDVGHLRPLEELAPQGRPGLPPGVLPAQRRVGLHGDALPPAVVDQLRLGIVRMEFNLIHRGGPHAGRPLERLEVADREVRDSDRPDLPPEQSVLHRPPRLGPKPRELVPPVPVLGVHERTVGRKFHPLAASRHRVVRGTRPVYQVQVEVVRPKPPEAEVEAPQRGLVAVVGPPLLRRQEQVRSADASRGRRRIPARPRQEGRQRLPDLPLGLLAAVDEGRVDVPVSRPERVADGPRDLPRALFELVRPETDDWHVQRRFLQGRSRRRRSRGPAIVVPFGRRRRPERPQ